MDGFDVSGLDTPWDDEEEESVTAQTQRRQTSCPGHERALPVDAIVRMLDMKEEGIFITVDSMLLSSQLESLDIMCLLFWHMLKEKSHSITSISEPSNGECSSFFCTCILQ